MLDYLYRLVTGFEREHGMRPNILYINPEHCEHLKSSFDERFSLGDIMRMLKMEVIVDAASVHPHVCWTHAADKDAS